jgi:hypothetical protein
VFCLYLNCTLGANHLAWRVARDCCTAEHSPVACLLRGASIEIDGGFKNLQCGFKDWGGTSEVGERTVLQRVALMDS